MVAVVCSHSTGFFYGHPSDNPDLITEERETERLQLNEAEFSGH